jgi:hypothetical protein
MAAVAVKITYAESDSGRRLIHDQAYAHHGGRRRLLIAVLAFGKYMQIQKLIAARPSPARRWSRRSSRAAEWQPQLNSVGTLAPVRGVDVTTEIAGLVRKCASSRARR